MPRGGRRVAGELPARLLELLEREARALTFREAAAALGCSPSGIRGAMTILQAQDRAQVVPRDVNGWRCRRVAARGWSPAAETPRDTAPKVKPRSSVNEPLPRGDCAAWDAFGPYYLEPPTEAARARAASTARRFAETARRLRAR